MRAEYPPVGSMWEVILCPTCDPCIVEVISSGHGIVAIKKIDGKYLVGIDILAWDRYSTPLPVKVGRK